MKRSSQALMALAIVGILSLTACKVSIDGDAAPGPIRTTPALLPQQPQETPVPQQPQQPQEPVNQLVEIFPTAGSCPIDGDLEGKFTSSDEMSSYLGCVLPAVDQWVDSIYKAMPHPRHYYFVPNGVSGMDVHCPYDQTVLQYCLESHNVYLGETAVWSEYSQYGDAAPALILAHEVTHSFQNEVGMPPVTTANEEIPRENQADCGAGAFMNYARQKGFLNPEDDIRDMAGTLQAAGEAESVDRTHGTTQERLNSFDLGYLSTEEFPLVSCVVFVPEYPIISVR